MKPLNSHKTHNYDLSIARTCKSSSSLPVLILLNSWFSCSSKCCLFVGRREVDAIGELICTRCWRRTMVMMTIPNQYFSEAYLTFACLCVAELRAAFVTTDQSPNIRTNNAPTLVFIFGLTRLTKVFNYKMIKMQTSIISLTLKQFSSCKPAWFYM